MASIKVWACFELFLLFFFTFGSTSKVSFKFLKRFQLKIAAIGYWVSWAHWNVNARGKLTLTRECVRNKNCRAVKSITIKVKKDLICEDVDVILEQLRDRTWLIRRGTIGSNISLVQIPRDSWMERNEQLPQSQGEKWARWDSAQSH